MNKSTQGKLRRLQQILQSYEKVAVGFSGGVDSSFLLAVAAETLGKKHVLAVTVDSVVFPRKEVDEAIQFAKARKIRHVLLPIDLTGIKQMVKNSPDRCYYCKRVVFSKIKEVAEKKHFLVVCDASNSDDMKEYRPGTKALGELGIRSPLVDVHLTKKEIRALSKQMKLPTWEKPAGACLATRFPYGDVLSQKKLRIIERAEILLRSFGVKQVRVRSHQTLARIEVTPRDIRRILHHADEIISAFKKLGFTYVTVDIEGYRAGSFDEVLDV